MSYGLTVKPPGEDEEGARFLVVDDSGLVKVGDEYENGWSLELPHQCDQWMIAQGTRGEVLEAAREFRAELDAVIAELEAKPQDRPAAPPVA